MSNCPILQSVFYVRIPIFWARTTSQKPVSLAFNVSLPRVSGHFRKPASKSALLQKAPYPSRKFPPPPAPMAEVPSLFGIVPGTAPIDLCTIHGARPEDLVVSDHIVGLTWVVPVADRRMKGYLAASFHERILGCSNWRNDLGPATTAAAVAGYTESPRDIENTFFESFRERLYVFRTDRINRHRKSSFTKLPEAMLH